MTNEEAIKEMEYELEVRRAYQSGKAIEIRGGHFAEWTKITKENDCVSFIYTPFKRHHRLHDPYRKFKEAEAAGKVVKLEGKTCEEFHAGSRSTWNYNGYPEKYTIHEPSEPEPKYKPFDDVMQLKGKWLKSKDGAIYSFPVSFSIKDNEVYTDVDGMWVSADYIFKHYTMEDGSPAGQIVEEEECH